MDCPTSGALPKRERVYLEASGQLTRRDIEEIWDRIAEDDFDTADRVLEEIRAAILRLVSRPLMGHVRGDLPPARYRFWPIYSYLISLSI